MMDVERVLCPSLVDRQAVDVKARRRE